MNAVPRTSVMEATGWDTHRNTMIRNGTIQPTSNTVVWESDPLPNECVVVSKSFPQDRAAALGVALAGLSDDEKKLLPWPYTGFVPATHQPYEGLEKMGRDLGAIRTS